MAEPHHPVLAARPVMTRHDTGEILSYYTSPEAGRSYNGLSDKSHYRQRQDSHNSSFSTPSDYSSDYSDDDAALTYPGSPKNTVMIRTASNDGGLRRRPSNPSKGADDKRRMVIMQLDSPTQTSRQLAVGRTGEVLGTRDGNVLDRPSRRAKDVNVPDLALIAPPDAAPSAYIDMSPASAPIREDGRGFPERVPISAPASSHHVRSASEVTTAERNRSVRRKKSRDVGIVRNASAAHPTTDVLQEKADNLGLAPPVFQTPVSRSGSPLVRRGSDDSAVRSMGSGQLSPEDVTPKKPWSPHGPLTPEIGQAKDVHDPVAGPVLVGLGFPQDHSWLSTPSPSMSRGSSSQSVPSAAGANSSRSSPAASPYLMYQPGVHATAGPLPPPPRALFEINPSTPAPPRPPRLHSPPPRSHPPITDDTPVRKSIERAGPSTSVPMRRADSDFSIAAMSILSGSDAEERTAKQPSYGTVLDDEGPGPKHIREGAFAPSTDSESQSAESAVKPARPPPEVTPIRMVKASSMPAAHPEALKSSTTIASTKSRASIRTQSSWVELRSSEIAQPSEERVGRTKDHGRSLARVKSLSPVRSDTEAGMPRSFKQTLANLKRFSALPRPPSLGSVSQRSHSGHGTGPSPISSRASSVEPQSVPRPATLPALPRRKIISPWPAPMTYQDVVKKRSPLERSLGYAQKINELADYDPGLADWMSAYVTNRSAGSKNASNLAPAGPSVRQFSQQPRQASHSSMESEVTFPVRPDAYLATDLSPRPQDEVASATSIPASLPYPNLLPTPRAPPRPVITSPPNSVRSLSATPMSKATGGFFSSIGRKASVRKEARQPTLPANNNVLSKPPPSPRPIIVHSAPIVPGGPRAPPGRVKRSHTLASQPSDTLVISAPMPSPEPSSSLSPPARPKNSPSPPVSFSGPAPKRRSSVLKRPSVWGGNKNSDGSGRESAGYKSEGESPARPDPEFAKQVNKLAELLPQADKDVLAGYLRRTGQDIIAIGQYLEDEKNGKIRRS